MPHPGDILSAGYLPYNYPGWIRVHCGKPEIPPNPIQDVGVTYGNYSNQQVTIRLDVQILGSTSLLKISGAYEITVEPQSVANIGFGFDYVRMVILNSCLTALGTIRLLVIDTSNNNILAKCNINSTVVTPIESQLELINPIIAPLLSYLNTLNMWMGPPDTPQLPTFDPADIPLLRPGVGVHIACQTGWGCVALVDPNCSECKYCPCDCINFCYGDGNCQCGINTGCCSNNTDSPGPDGGGVSILTIANIYNKQPLTNCGIKPPPIESIKLQTQPIQIPNTSNTRGFFVGSFGGHYAEQIPILFQYVNDTSFISPPKIETEHGFKAYIGYMGFITEPCMPYYECGKRIIRETEVPVFVTSVGTPAGYFGILKPIIPPWNVLQTNHYMYLRVESCYEIKTLGAMTYLNDNLPSTPPIETLL